MKNPRLHTTKEYIKYMRAYHRFYERKLAIFGKSSLRLDSQFSESIAADYFDFTLEHKNGVDGHNKNGESCEVKGTGYNNTRVRFTPAQKSADHIYWIKADKNNKKVLIQEIDLSRCTNNFNKDGFITLENKNCIIKSSYSIKY